MGLYFLRARYLDVSTGRFWTQDSYEGDLQNPASLHKYYYTHNDPINFVDPSGRKELIGILGTLSILAILAIMPSIRDNGAQVFSARSLNHGDIQLFIYPNQPTASISAMEAGAIIRREPIGIKYRWVSCFKTNWFADPQFQGKGYENQWIEDPPSGSPLHDEFPFYWPAAHNIERADQRDNLGSVFTTVFVDRPSRKAGASHDEDWTAVTYLVESSITPSWSFKPVYMFEWGFEIKSQKVTRKQPTLPKWVYGSLPKFCRRI